MRLDSIIGILLAALIYTGLAFSHKIFPPSKKSTPADDSPPPTLNIKIPQLEPEPPEETIVPLDETQPAADIADLAPPMQTDVPAPVVTPSTFLQKLQPPPPNPGNLETAITIPKTHFQNTGASGIKALFDLDALDQKPVPRFRVNPTYPYQMRNQRIEGKVVIGFIVTSEGDVLNPYIISSTRPEFDAESLRAISKWKFKPGRKNGADVNTRNVQQPFDFRLH